MTYYKKHVFLCTNQRTDGRKCCANGDAAAICHYAKQQLRAKNLMGPGKLRLNAAGCMDRCSEGPVMVIYPEGIWYYYETKADVDEIIEQHLCQGIIVKRLLLEPQ